MPEPRIVDALMDDGTYQTATVEAIAPERPGCLKLRLRDGIVWWAECDEWREITDA